MPDIISIPPKPPTWVLSAPCQACEGCAKRALAEDAILFLSEHYAQAIERVDPRWPGYLRSVDGLMAERQREVAAIASAMPYCDNLSMVAV